MAKAKSNSPQAETSRKTEVPIQMTDAAAPSLPAKMNPAENDQLREDTEFTKRTPKAPRRWSPCDDF